MITGGYAGVGHRLSSILYSKNATVWIAGRSESKAEKTIDSIKAEHPNSNGALKFLKVDLSDLTTIKPAAETFLRQETKLHWLDQNAAVMVPPKGSRGAQGMDLQYQTNILGPFLLMKLLQPILKKTAQSEPRGSVRVSWAGSLAAVLQSPPGGVTFTQDGKDLKEYAPPPAYGVTKAANYLLGAEFGKRSGTADGILHNVSFRQPFPRCSLTPAIVLQPRQSPDRTPTSRRAGLWQIRRLAHEHTAPLSRGLRFLHGALLWTVERSDDRKGPRCLRRAVGQEMECEA